MNGGMMRNIGPLEIIIVLVVVLLVFGPGRIVKVAGEMGESIKAFKDGLGKEKKSEDDQEKEQESESKS
jgi:sec-independent protein translocase protein TatA